MTIYNIVAICMLIVVFWPPLDTLREIDNFMLRTR